VTDAPGSVDAAPAGTGSPRVTAVRAAIERDRSYLREMLAGARPDTPDPERDARLAEIADRLPRLQAELDALLDAARR
jgi:hypothetical protein